ncbi:ABC transporter substrate-binding protein [Magnetospira sp. QH-2]|uniref:substrate-binding periplasmic protein n=1 Tax=Magnetospira sp. (strain QH-2) TaxID=1288970 RepID=UPI0003E80DA6|nr:transporter substrate-binding domain-containing protein [Magnetospira sp. QH-2]CCQ75546.1 Putative ABC-type amino acid transport/signal transduction systems, periplasmic component/domain [Magnetospira sp. QH-2]
MLRLMIGLLLLGGLLWGQGTRAEDGGLTLVSATMPHGLLEEIDGKVTGAYAAFFHEASRRSGIPIKIKLFPWARALKNTEKSKELLIFPFTRNADREERFSWIAPLLENPVCFATLGAKIDSLDDARNLKRAIVWRGSSPQTFLEAQGFKNLIETDNLAHLTRILKRSPNSGWAFNCNEAQTFIDGEKKTLSLVVGAPVWTEVSWLAGGRSFASTPAVVAFTQAMDALREEKYLEKRLAEVGQ